MSAPTFFTPAQLTEITATTIPAATDPSHTNAVVFGLDQTGGQVVGHFVLNDQGAWELDAEAAVKESWTGDLSAGAQVVLKW